MPAGMHFAGNLTFILYIGLLVYRKSIHICPYQHCLTRLTSGNSGDKTSLSDFLDLKSHSFKLIFHKWFCEFKVKTKLRVHVKLMSDTGELILQLFCFCNQFFCIHIILLRKTKGCTDGAPLQ